MTTPTTTFTTTFIEGFAQLFANADIGLAWSATGDYDDGTPIFIGRIPQSPDQMVSLDSYTLAADAASNMSLIGLQVRIRSGADDRRPLSVIDDAISDLLLGNYPLTLPTGVRISWLDFTGSSDLGQDDNQRWEWVANYRANTYRPTQHRN